MLCFESHDTCSDPALAASKCAVYSSDEVVQYTIPFLTDLLAMCCLTRPIIVARPTVID